MIDRRSEDGFTLIELMVTILIIAVLAAIAIPVFMKQREKGWRAQTQTALKNTAVAEEAFIVDHGSYTGDIDSLIDEQGLRFASDVDVAIPLADAGVRYCVEAQHPSLGETWHYASAAGTPTQGACS